MSAGVDPGIALEMIRGRKNGGIVYKTVLDHYATMGVAGARILIAEDEDLVAKFLQSALERAGYQVQVCMEGTSALQAAVRQPHDLIITDYRMPGMNGFDLLRAVRVLPQAPKVMLLTGTGLPPHVQMTLERWGVPVLAKPIGLEALYTAVRQILTRPAA